MRNVLFILLLLGLSIPQVFGACKDDNFDVYKVATARQSGADKDHFLLHVNAAPDIDETRKDRIRKLVDELFAMEQDLMGKYITDHTATCDDA